MKRNSKIFSKKSSKSNKAFSLIELSIVVLIIGLVVVGVIGGKKLVTLSNLTKARALTNSAPVAGIENLALWLEATSKNSFLTAQPADSSAIATWNDINPQLTVKKSATQATGANQPLYIANAMNGLPAVRFDGTNDSMLYDGSFLINTDFSVFIVEQRSTSSASYLIGGGSATDGLTFGYSTNTNLYLNTNATNTTATTTGFSSSPRLIEAVLSSTSGAPLAYAYVNGALLTSPSGVSLPLITAYTTPSIGVSVAAFYNGNIGEVIIFNRAISDFERQQIEKYLAKKWGITLA